MGPDQGLVLAESLANQEVKDRFLEIVTNLFRSKKMLKKNKPMLSFNYAIRMPNGNALASFLLPNL
jgi:hypothetical protein